MRVVSVGDLVTDYYYLNGKLLGVNGGMTSHNVIANLANMGISTSVFASCGNDVQGKIAIKSLEDLKVDVTNVKVLDPVRTRCFHVSYFSKEDELTFLSKKRCPFCNNKKWYAESLIDCNDILNKIQEDDVLVFDNLNEKNQFIIDSVKNKKILDLGQYFEFEELSAEEIVKKLKNKFEIINFNERVTHFLVTKLKVKNDLELYRKIKPKFMTITRGEGGATFLFEDKIYSFDLFFKGKVVDFTGAGDAFISSIIKDCLKNNFQYNSDLFSKWYENSNRLTKKVVSKMGARGHIYPLFKIKKVENLCTCDTFEAVDRKKIKRCNININNLETRILHAMNSGASKKIQDIDFNERDNCLFIGTGGSYAGAYFASKVINFLFGANTYPLYPRDVLYRNNKNIHKVILFSYSGTTNDIIRSIQGFEKKNVYIVTKGELKTVVLKTGLLKKNILCYRTASNKGKERGFLSFEGSVAPASIFLKYYYRFIQPSFDLNDFIRTSISYWKTYLDTLFNKEIVKKLKESGLIHLFRGDYSDTAVYDLESKMIESGIFTCIMHEKKNFSHGRFIHYENLKNAYSIYFKQKSTSKYEEELLKYLGENIVLIESRYDGILAEFDLLIASQYVIYFIGKRLDIDVSKPKYSENALKIYFYKGEL